MGPKDWDRIISSWSDGYYMAFCWLACAVITIITIIVNFKKTTLHFSFLIYAIANFLLVNIGLDYLNNFLKLNPRESAIFLETANTIFAIIEISLFLFYFSKILAQSFIRHVIFASWVTFSLICTSFFSLLIKESSTRHEIRTSSFLINGVEFFILIVFCLKYFSELLGKQGSYDSLGKSPSFLIVTGLFLYCIISLPTLLISENIRNDRLLYSMGAIHYCALSLSLLCTAKAFSCKIALTK